eukprot:4284833-Prymnesium_polylepis.1
MSTLSVSSEYLPVNFRDPPPVPNQPTRGLGAPLHLAVSTSYPPGAAAGRSAEKPQLNARL